jgi:ribosomal protein L1
VLESSWWALCLSSREVKKESSQRRIDTQLTLFFTISTQRETKTYAPHLYIRYVVVKSFKSFIRSSSHLSHFPLFIHSYQPVVHTTALTNHLHPNPSNPKRQSYATCTTDIAALLRRSKATQQAIKNTTCHIVIGQTFVARRMGNPRPAHFLRLCDG